MAIIPSEQQLQELTAIAGTERDGPKVMLNLNAFKRPNGREEYMRYGLVALKVIERVGGKVLWAAESHGSIVGEDAERWDEVIAVWYPSAKAFLDLAGDAELLAAHAHREAGLERAAVVVCEAGEEPVLALPG